MAQGVRNGSAEVCDHLFCTVCGNYLSVGPILVDSEDVVCGRCPQLGLSDNDSYDIIVSKYSFKCVNNYAGCPVICELGDVLCHEKTCMYDRDFECPCCLFYGNSCRLWRHFNALHANSVVHADTLEGILSYHNLEDYIVSLAHMTEDDLEVFVCTAVKMFLVCNVCRGSIGSVVNICSNYHSACSKCATRSCSKCAKPTAWNSDTRLHKVLLRCRWPGCDRELTIFKYLVHKARCKYRQYKCPNNHCKESGDLEWLREHSHMSLLTDHTSDILIDKVDYVYYWLTPQRDILKISRRLYQFGIVSVEDEDVIFTLGRVSVIFTCAANYKRLEFWKYRATQPIRYSCYNVYDNVIILSS